MKDLELDDLVIEGTPCKNGWLNIKEPTRGFDIGSHIGVINQGEASEIVDHLTKVYDLKETASAITTISQNMEAMKAQLDKLVKQMESDTRG